MFDFSKEKIVAGFEESLQRLGLDYVDVLQVGKRHEFFIFRWRSLLL
jgi:aryl-alcohol dehydrogenase-like predicted oxidoreductase